MLSGEKLHQTPIVALQNTELTGIILKHAGPTAHCNTRGLPIQKPTGFHSCFETYSLFIAKIKHDTKIQRLGKTERVSQLVPLEIQ